MMAGYIHGATFDRVVPCGPSSGPSRTARDQYRSSSKSAKQSPTKDGTADRQREVLRRFAIVGSYVGVWVCFYLLVHASGGDNKATQNSTTLVLIVEVIKIIASAGFFVLWHGFDQLLVFLGSPDLGSLCVSYAPVALLYAIYNNLMFLNLKANNPTTYLTLSSSRLLITALIWQIAFKIDIPTVRKISLFVITAGIVVQGWSSEHETQQDGDNLHGIPFPRILFIVVQMSCSVLASVYNETLLKKTSVSPHLQNLCLCLNSIAANVIIGVIARATCIRKYGDVDLLGDLQLLDLSPQNVAVVLTLAIAGIMSSMVLRYETRAIVHRGHCNESDSAKGSQPNQIPENPSFPSRASIYRRSVGRTRYPGCYHVRYFVT